MKTTILPTTSTTNSTETKFKSALSVAGQLFSRATRSGAVILVCPGAAAQNPLMSGKRCWRRRDLDPRRSVSSDSFFPSFRAAIAGLTARRTKEVYEPARTQ